MTTSTNNLAEHSKIMDVIACETEMFVRQDFAGWAECWVQDDRTREVCISSSLGATVLEGWTALANYMQNVMENGATCKISDVQRFNKHANGRIEKTFETRTLERSDGVWRILYASFVLHGHQHTDSDRLTVNANGDILCAPKAARQKMISNNRLRATRPAWDKILQAGLARAAEQHGYFQHYRYMTESGQN